MADPVAKSGADTPETRIYDHACAVSRGDRVRELEAVLHAILQRYHPNGCELSRMTLTTLRDNHRYRFVTSENPVRDTIILSSQEVR